ncbi:MAG: LEA type 2 family protein [Pseudohongiellaceae bacterium]
MTSTFWLARSGFIALLMTSLLSCSGLQSGFEQPTVSLTSFRMVPSGTAVPRFEIGLQISNPNRTELRLQGISYQIDLEGYRVLSGVSNELPIIAAYGTGDVLLQASPDLLSSVALFSDLLNQRRDSLRFNLEANIDAGSRWRRIRVERSGDVSLSGLRR